MEGGHEYVHELAEIYRRSHCEVSVVHHDPSAGKRREHPSTLPKHEYHIIFSTTELYKGRDPTEQNAHYVFDHFTGSPHRVTVRGEEAYTDLMNMLRLKFGHIPGLLEYAKKHTFVMHVEDRGRKINVFHVGLPFVIRDGSGNLRIYTPDIPFSFRNKDLDEKVWHIIEKLPKDWQKSVGYVLQGEYAISDGKRGPRFLATGNLQPCVAVVIHDRKNGRAAIMHVDDGRFFEKWKEIVREMESGGKGEYKLYVVGSRLKGDPVFGPFVVKPEEYERYGHESVGLVSKYLVEKLREGVQELKKEGIEIQEPFFIHSASIAIDVEKGTLHPFKDFWNFEEMLKDPYRYPERYKHFHELFEEGGRKKMYRVEFR